MIDIGRIKPSLLRKIKPENNAIDKIGVKFGGGGANLIKHAATITKNKNILFI